MSGTGTAGQTCRRFSHSPPLREIALVCSTLPYMYKHTAVLRNVNFALFKSATALRVGNADEAVTQTDAILSYKQQLRSEVDGWHWFTGGPLLRLQGQVGSKHCV